MTPPSLLAMLGVLASIQSSPRERNQACRELDAFLRQRLHGLLKDVGRTLSEEDHEDTLQHLLVQASTGTARCKAQSEGEAWSWCRTVARNFALDLIGKQAKTRNNEQTSQEPSDTGSEPGEQQELSVVQRQITRAKEVVEQSSRGKDKSASVACAVEYCFQGATIEAQILRWAFSDNPPPAPTAQELRKARDRVYAYRSRGVKYLLEALGELEMNHEFNAQELQLTRTILTGMKRG